MNAASIAECEFCDDAARTILYKNVIAAIGGTRNENMYNGLEIAFLGLVRPMRDKLESDVCAEKLKALADRDRLKIIQCLRKGPHNVTQLTQALGAEMANVSHHLQVLRHAGLVNDRKDGKYVIYSLAPEVASPDGVELGCCRLELPKK